MSVRSAAWLAWFMLMVSLIFGALGCLLLFLNDRSSTTDAWYTLAFLAFPIVGVVISSRRPENPIGWMFCVIGAANSLYFFAGEYALYTSTTRPGALSGGAWLARSQDWTAFIMWSLLFFSLMLFPGERLPASRWRLVALVVAAVLIMMSPLFFVVILGAPVLLLVRFWRARGEERQQIKWFAYAAGFWIGVAGLLALNRYVLHEPLVEHAANVLFGVAVASIPVAVGHRHPEVPPLRHRRRHQPHPRLRLAHYVARARVRRLRSLLAVRFPRVGWTGTSQLAVVASTLAVAALFGPLRRRIQGTIDRRFYRRKYDAAKTLEAFSATLRDETDLDRLGDEMVSVVRETVQPATPRCGCAPSSRPPTGERERPR